MSGAATASNSRRQPTAEEFQQMQSSPDFAELRGAYRNFTFPMTVAFFSWFIVYILTATFAPDFLGIRLVGQWNVGILMGLLQFASTFIITWIYVKHANKNIEPRAAAIREKLEG